MRALGGVRQSGTETMGARKPSSFPPGRRWHISCAVRKSCTAGRTAVTDCTGFSCLQLPISHPCAAGPVPTSAPADHRIPDAVGRTGAGVDFLRWSCGHSSGSVIVVQQSAETLSSFHLPALADEFRLRVDQLVAEPLVVAFEVVVSPT